MFTMRLFAPLMLMTSLVAAFPPVSTSEKRAALKSDAQFNFEPFKLTNICLDCDRPNATATYSCRVKFDWYDPNSVKENPVSSCTCNSTAFSWDGTEGTTNTNISNSGGAYELCSWAGNDHDYSYFEMRLFSFQTAENFTLEIAHHYKDEAQFPAPYQYPTTFARPTLTLPVVHKDEKSTSLYAAGPVNATVVGIAD
ncbi:hypothetical protein QBC46DRAFT_138541 [Diplogelasinospora grovesii]|uniref:Uncharacterized protein n=1 Tax=Diplogelasinospora grovesii TaxID=303347 RepID=A0AAN6S4V7_9PEZI|nr:hypothetical protein QBC46DRAFT_138541 [Diplogelasinospora grovesii]